jgi:GntR family transcriptional regulator, rspAB operon transcriptional repressor
MKASAEASSLADEAYGIVRRRIVRGTVRLGQVISRRKLAAELGMSFLPVSMALLRLEFEGLLESRPRAGTRVRIPSREDVLGQYVVREALEVQAAKLFANVATLRERAELRKLAKRVDALALSQADRIPYVIAHQALHRRIAECTRCPALSTTIEQTNALASIWFCVARQPSPNDPKRRHQDLIEALSAGNPDLAATAMREHILCGLQHTMEVLEPYFQLRKASGSTFIRSQQKQRQILKSSNH